MKEQAGIVAGIITFLGFSALCVWHHAIMPDPLLSTTPHHSAPPPATTQAPGAPAILPTSTSPAGSLPVTTLSPKPGPIAPIPQVQTEPPIQEHSRQQPLTPSLRGKVIEFFADSDVLTPKGRGALDTLLPELRSPSVQQVEIAGHTDNLGTEDYNRNLSQRRAEMVKHYFMTQGIAEEHLIAQGYGSSLPIADNATAEGRQRNRRTEIIIHRTAAGN